MLEDVFFGTGPIRKVQQWIGLGHADVFRWIGLLGDLWGIILVLGIALWLYGRKTTYIVVGSIAFAAVTKALMNLAFYVPRPSGEGIVVYEQIELSSLPSGHVYQTLIPWGVLYVRERLPLILPAVLIGAVGLSRMYLGVHYLGDVLFTIVLGVALVPVYISVWNHSEGWLGRRSVQFYAGLMAVGIVGVLATAAIGVSPAHQWEIVGLLTGAGVALFVERKWVNYRPPSKNRARVVAVLTGLAGLLPLAFVVRYIGGADWYWHALTGLALGLWTLLVAPLLIQSISASEEGPTRTVRRRA